MKLWHGLVGVGIVIIGIAIYIFVWSIIQNNVGGVMLSLMLEIIGFLVVGAGGVIKRDSYPRT